MGYPSMNMKVNIRISGLAPAFHAQLFCKKSWIFKSREG